MSDYIRCINCENHSDHEMSCKINHENYNKKFESGTNLSECFVKCKLHASMDSILDKLTLMNETLDGNSENLSSDEDEKIPKPKNEF